MPAFASEKKPAAQSAITIIIRFKVCLFILKPFLNNLSIYALSFTSYHLALK